MPGDGSTDAVVHRLVVLGRVHLVVELEPHGCLDAVGHLPGHRLFVVAQVQDLKIRHCSMKYPLLPPSQLTNQLDAIFCTTSLLLASTLIDIINPLSTVPSSAANKSQQHWEKNCWEC